MPPPISIRDLAGGGLMVLAPHPDDEVLGCGGAIALARDVGIPVLVVALTDGDASHPGSLSHPRDRLAVLRATEQRRGLDRLGSGIGLHRLGLADGALATMAVEDMAARLHRQLGAMDGDRSTLLSTAPDDPHPDHRAAFRLASVLATRADLNHFTFPVRAWIDARQPEPGDRWLDIRGALDRKRRALAAHASQTSDLIHDVPDGFRLTEADLALHLSPAETFTAVR